MYNREVVQVEHVPWLKFKSDLIFGSNLLDLAQGFELKSRELLAFEVGVGESVREEIEDYASVVEIKKWTFLRLI